MGETGSDETQASWRRHLLVAFIVGLLVRAAAAWFLGAAEPQEIRYITIARSIAAGEGFRGLDSRFPDIIQPPLFPVMLVAVAGLPVPDLAAARGVSIFMGALLVFPVALLARRVFGATAGVRAGFLVSFYPLLAYISALALTESTFAVLVTASVLLLLRCLDAETIQTRRRLGYVVGFVMGGSYLVRPEGLTYIGVACVVTLIALLAARVAWGRILSVVALMAGGFVTVAIPYIAWVHGQTGQWLLAPKAVLFQVYHKLEVEGLRERWEEPFGSLLFGERMRFGLNAEGTAIRAHEEYSRVHVGLSEGVLLSEEGQVAPSDPALTARKILQNSTELYLETIKHGFVIPMVLLVLASIGLLSRPWVGGLRRDGPIVAAFFLGSFSFLLTHIQARFLYAALPFALPWIAEGWVRVERWLEASLGGFWQGSVGKKGLKLLTAGAVTILCLPHLMTAVESASGRSTEHRRMGLWIRESLPGDPVVMAITPIVSYYADVRFDAMPYAAPSAVMAYARRRDVDYLIADASMIPLMRPQLKPWLSPARPAPGLELVKAMRAGSAKAIYLYRVVPDSENSGQE